VFTEYIYATTISNKFVRFLSEIAIGQQNPIQGMMVADDIHNIHNGVTDSPNVNYVGKVTHVIEDDNSILVKLKIPGSVPSFNIESFAILSGNDKNGFVVLSEELQEPIQKQSGVSVTLAIKISMT